MKNPELLTLKISSQDSHESFDVEWVEIEAPNGSFTLFPGHHDLVSQIKVSSEITFKNPSGTISTLPTTGGIVLAQNGKTVSITIFNNSN